jgi:ABC-type transporter MlaC component
MKFKTLGVAAVLFLGSSGLSRADETAKDPVKEPAKEVAKEAAPLSPEAQKLKDEMIDLFELSKKVAVPEAAERKKARERVERSLDWEKISRDCLGPKRWSAQSPKARQEFRDLLQEVVARTAFTRLDKFWNDTKSYGVEKVEVKGKVANVAAKYVVEQDDILLEYFLQKSGGKWLIYDIAYEDLKYSENISEQINAFMKDNNFNTLLDKLRKRRDELKDEKPASPTKKS